MNSATKSLVKVRHKVVLKNLSENVRRSGIRNSLKQAQKDAGYSESYAHSGRIKGTKAWNEIMEEYFPDEFVAKIHREQLEAKDLKQIPFFYKLTDKDIKEKIEEQGFTFFSAKRFMNQAYVYFSVPDTMARDKALDKIYKLKQKYAPTRFEHEFEGWSNEQLIEFIARGVIGES